MFRKYLADISLKMYSIMIIVNMQIYSIRGKDAAPQINLENRKRRCYHYHNRR